MIVKYISNPKVQSSKAVRIGNLLDYIEADGHADAQKAEYIGASGNFYSDSQQGQRAEMVALAMETKRSKDPVDHWLLSWKEGEQPTQTQCDEAVEILKKNLGMNGSHLAVYALHRNTENYHLHVVYGAGYGFQPGGWQSRDENIFRDTDQSYNTDGTVSAYASAYLITASDSLGTAESSSSSTCSYANDSTAIFKMTSDYLGIDTTTKPATNGANWVFVCDQREAPVMFKKDSKYFLITSQAAGWYPSQGGYGVSSNALTGWTSDPINLGSTSTFGGQTSDGFVIAGTQGNTYVLTFDHLGGADSKNPSSNEKYDTGSIWLPVILDSTAGTATLNWYPSWTVDNTTGTLTLPTMTNLAHCCPR